MLPTQAVACTGQASVLPSPLAKVHLPASAAAF